MICGVAYQTECIPATSTEPGIFRWDALNAIAERIAEIKSNADGVLSSPMAAKSLPAFPAPIPVIGTSNSLS